ncbi:MAG: hypothetical protein HY681_08420 [Chloroflexi bacterium]|nr:hypothetical protein [Chloroflexota bacterium]
MKWKEWLERRGMTSLRITPPFLEMEWAPKDQDKDAAWELYVELLTRTTTQRLPADAGDEAAALESIHDLFGLTREIIRRRGRLCLEFSKIAIVILNQKIRPFTTKWHKELLEGALDTPARVSEFRTELGSLQSDLRAYAKMLADMAGVEDLTDLEEPTQPTKHAPARK